MFKNIKVLIWDFDGTLYKPVPEMAQDRLESAYRVIMLHTNWSREKAITEFQNIYPNKTPSITQATTIVSNIPLPQAAYENELYKHRETYVKPDPKLVQLFTKLKHYTHYMLVNGIQEETRKMLRHIGISTSVFKEIVTSEIVGVNKPSEKGFRYILEKTKLPPEEHLMIGDREAVDLAPAKALGMKTCLVWSDTKSEVADVTLKTVYELDTQLEPALPASQNRGEPARQVDSS